MIEKKEKVFEELLLEVRRVTRVTTWWRRLSFRAVVLVWDRKWKIWLWISKAWDVSSALQKAIHEAYKNIVDVNIVWNNTIPYQTTIKYKSAIVKILPASAGTWLKAWSSVRSVLDIAWYSNVLSKIIWTNNRLNNALATIMALSKFKMSQKELQKKEQDKIASEELIKNSKTLKEISTDTDNVKKVSWNKSDNVEKIPSAKNVKSAAKPSNITKKS